MLPPSQFGDEEGPAWEDISNQNVFQDEEQFNEIKELISDWKDASGFDLETWIEGITDIRNIEYNDDGDIIGFDFDFDIGDGEYTGTRSV